MSQVPLKCREAFVETEIDGEAVLMALDSGRFFALRDTAARIWRLIDGRRDRAAIVAALQAQYAAAPDAVGRDVESFLMKLQEAGFIE